MTGYERQEKAEGRPCQNPTEELLDFDRRSVERSKCHGDRKPDITERHPTAVVSETTRVALTIEQLVSDDEEASGGLHKSTDLVKLAARFNASMDMAVHRDLVIRAVERARQSDENVSFVWTDYQVGAANVL